VAIASFAPGRRVEQYWVVGVGRCRENCRQGLFLSVRRGYVPFLMEW